MPPREESPSKKESIMDNEEVETSESWHDNNAAAAAAAAAADNNVASNDIENNTEEPAPSSSNGANPKKTVRQRSSALSTDDEPLFQFMTGIKEDLDARAPLYRDDWSKPRSIFTVVNATVFAFVIQLIPALIFAELMARETENNLSVAEVVLSSAVIGIIYAIFAGQPLVIMGITGPVAILLGTSYRLTAKFDADYFPFFFWICIWAGAMHILSSMVGLVNLVWKVTPFTSQIFELFIGVSFIYLSCRDLIEPLYLGQSDVDGADRAGQYATLLLGTLTCYISYTLHFAETWMLFTRQVRTVLTSYNTLIAVVIVTGLSYLPGIDMGTLDRVDIIAPWDWQPTADRSWVTNPMQGMSANAVFGAMVPGFMFFLLFIIDHNVSSILSQLPKYNLQKPAAYHWDFFVLGITFIPCAILGLPPGNGLIPQAPLHVRALCTRKLEADKYGVKREVVTYVEEQRWSGLGQALLMFVALAAFRVISWIPRGALFGLLLYLGIGALHGNEIWERTIWCLMIPKKRPPVPVVTDVKWRTVQLFTLIQLACTFLVFGVANFTSVGYIYPALLVILVPIRSYILSRIFSRQDLKRLDPHGKGEEDEDHYHDEQRIIHHQRNDSIDSEELDFPNRAEFRGQGRKQLHHRHTSNMTEDKGEIGMEVNA
mmetsp:Transcript_33396/g.67399  ORF Transcript_33396/g.67399 Transcript_33396/m.67399 type:complete len:657 (+) Transcript_33396:230-2200(+)